MFFKNVTGSKLIALGIISITKSAKFSTEKIHIHILVETIIYMSTTLVSTWASCLTSYFVFCRFKSPTKNIPYSATFRNYFHFLPHRCWWRYRVQNISQLSSTASLSYRHHCSRLASNIFWGLATSMLVTTLRSWWAIEDVVDRFLHRKRHQYDEKIKKKPLTK